MSLVFMLEMPASFDVAGVSEALQTIGADSVVWTMQGNAEGEVAP
ncbi:MAG TPA: hypothetical protein VKX16_07120 [Chloroflexota bacterium]|nr:hypothetical protein [Chloroflexota bacterium]